MEFYKTPGSFTNLILRFDQEFIRIAWKFVRIDWKFVRISGGTGLPESHKFVAF